MTKMQKHILIMAGGTGGHVFPGLAVADVLISRGHLVSWMGTRSGIEARLVPEAGLTIHYIDIAGVRGKGMFGLLMAPVRVSRAIVQSFFVFLKVRPNAVLGMGGFVSGPGAIAAKFMKIPLLVHEQNAVAGTTNRILFRFADHVFEAFPGTFPKSEKVMAVGNPVRGNLPDKKPYASGQKLRILVLGGSRGASAINELLPDLAAEMAGCIEIWHQTGEQQQQEVTQKYKASAQNARVDAFIDDMAAAYGWADLLICRAGAMTVSEVACVGLPAIFIPFPFAIDDHQTANASWLAEKGAAVIVQQKDMTIEKLRQLLNEFDQNREKLATMAEKTAALAQHNAANAVAEKCLELSR